MTLHLDIPESVTASLRAPAAEMEPRLLLELAVALYAQGILSFGQSSELANLSRSAFAENVSDPGVARHYGEADLALDIDYARRK